MGFVAARPFVSNSLLRFICTCRALVKPARLHCARTELLNQYISARVRLKIGTVTSRTHTHTCVASRWGARSASHRIMLCRLNNVWPAARLSCRGSPAGFVVKRITEEPHSPATAKRQPRARFSRWPHCQASVPYGYETLQV